MHIEANENVAKYLTYNIYLELAFGFLRSDRIDSLSRKARSRLRPVGLNFRSESRRLSSTSVESHTESSGLIRKGQEARFCSTSRDTGPCR